MVLDASGQWVATYMRAVTSPLVLLAALVLLVVARCQHLAIDINGSPSEDVGEDVDHELLNNEGLPLVEIPQLGALGKRCQLAMRRALAEDVEAPPRPMLYPDPMTGVSVSPRARADDVRLVFYVLASRPSAPAVFSRIVRALYSPSHLFLVHVDLKANETMHEQLVAYAAARKNVHVLKTRRLVQWGGFSMVAAMLDALSSFVRRVDFDFFINLSDAELPLRTSDELTAFLRRFKGRAFMRVDPPQAEAAGEADPAAAADHGSAASWQQQQQQEEEEQEEEEEEEQQQQQKQRQQQRQRQQRQQSEEWQRLARRRHAFWDRSLRRHAVIECGGFGFVGVNSSANSSTMRASIGPTCCYGQSGPLLHVDGLPFRAPEPPKPSLGEFRGSQWAILPADLCRHLLTDEVALHWARIFERRLLADEWYLPTVLMYSEYWRSAVRLPLRYDEWPASDDAERSAYYAALPHAEWGGALLLDGAGLQQAQRSPFLFAKKAVPSHDPTLLRRHDAWMSRKLRGEIDPDQPPIAAPYLRVDPYLDSFGVPPPLGSPAAEDEPPVEDLQEQQQQQQQQRRQQRQQQQRTDGDGHGDERSAAAAAVVRPPHRARGRRRRVASFVFSDGSSCSCAADCVPSATPWAASSAEGAPFSAAAWAVGGVVPPPDDASCCMHAPDGRAALCDGGGSEAVAEAVAEAARGTAWDGALPSRRLGLRPCPPPQLRTLASAASAGMAVTVLFLNRSPYPVRVLTVDVHGLEDALLSLRPAEHAEVNARTSQAWRARTLGGALLLELEATPPVDVDTDVASVHIHDCGGAF